MNQNRLSPKKLVTRLLCMLVILASGFLTPAGAQTNLGKDFWLAETPNIVGGDFAISVANPGTVPATISITNAVRATVNATIAPGALQTFTFTSDFNSIQGTAIYTRNVYHVASNKDVVVYDFTPLTNAFTNDAALILPTNSLGKKYRPGSYVNAAGNSNGSFFGILATENNTTVKTYNRSGVLVDNVVIQQGQYFQRNNGSAVASDVTGWYIESDKPTAVFAGNVCTSAGNSTGACDHIDEQILPQEAMASSYVASPTNSRPIGCTTCAQDIFRYVATEDGTVITTSPNVGGGTINKGQFVEITTNVPHIVSSNAKPFYGYQYLVSQNSGTPLAGTGDPALLAMPPVDQFQFSYLFLTPNTYAYDFINVVAPVGTTFTLDGNPITLNLATVGSIGSTTYAGGKLQVGDGAHKIAANKQFGLSVSGFDQFASYAYVGGVGLQPINAGCNTGGPYQLTACSITPIQLNGNATCSDGSAPSSIQWTSTDGVVFSNANIANPTATVPGYGTFNICLKVVCGTDIVTCCSQITVTEPAGGCNTPPVALCRNRTLIANSGCFNTAAIPASFNNGSFDPNGDAITLTVSPAAPYPVGVTFVTLTVTDSKGASSSCVSTLTVVDAQPPVVTAPAAITIAAPVGSCSVSAPVLGTATATDNCAGVSSVSNNAPASFPVGTTLVTWTATDAAGNVGLSTQNVTVTNSTPPVVATPVAITASNSAGTCGALVSVSAPVAAPFCGNSECFTDNIDSYTVGEVSGQSPRWTPWPGSGGSGLVTTSNSFSAPNSVRFTNEQDQLFLLGNKTSGVWTISWKMFVPAGRTAYFNTQKFETAGLEFGQQVQFSSNGNGILQAGGAFTPFAYPQGQWFDVRQVVDLGADSATFLINNVAVKTWQFSRQANNNPGTKQLGAIDFFAFTGILAGAEPNPSAVSEYYVDDVKYCGGTTLVAAGTRSDNQPLAAAYPVGTTTISWTATDAGGLSTTVTQPVTVNDTEAPVVSCPAATQPLCSTASGSYTIAPATASDNCGISSVSYSITGSTTRSGSGANASGSFNVGTSVIRWTVTDIHGNASSCATTIVVNAPVTASIPSVYAVSPGGAPNTLYTGYGPATVTLSANAGGGTAPYTYLWSTGATTSSLVVSAAGTYTVTVTDKFGCFVSASKTITVVDVRCGNKNDKVLVCQVPPGNPGNANNICVSANAVATHLANGSYLGACTIAPATTRTGATRPAVTTEPAAVSAYPNPSRNVVNLRLSNFAPGRVRIEVADANGRLLTTRESSVSYSTEDLSLVLTNLPAGVYHLRIVSGATRLTTKVMLVH
jgi:hypothetical protein